MPKLRKLTLENFIIGDDASYLKQFNQMNFASIEYLQLEGVITKKIDTIFRELAKISFPSLKRLTVDIDFPKSEMFFGPQECEPLTEATLEYFVNRVPSIISIQFNEELESKISQKFLVKMFKEANVLLIFGKYFSIYVDEKHRKMEKFIEKKVGSSLFEKYKTMKNELSGWYHGRFL